MVIFCQLREGAIEKKTSLVESEMFYLWQSWIDSVVTLDDAILGWCDLRDKVVKSSWRIFLMKYQFSGWISALVSRSCRIMPLAPFADPFKRVEVKEEIEVRYLSPEILCVGWGWSRERILLTRMQYLRNIIADIKCLSGNTVSINIGFWRGWLPSDKSGLPKR